MRLTRVLSSAAAVALVTGCASPQKDLDPRFGQALRQNIAAQTAEPEPARGRSVLPASSGARASAASRRYNAGQVIPPVSQGASTIGGGGGGAGAAPAGPAGGGSPR